MCGIQAVTSGCCQGGIQDGLVSVVRVVKSTATGTLRQRSTLRTPLPLSVGHGSYCVQEPMAAGVQHGAGRVGSAEEECASGAEGPQ